MNPGSLAADVCGIIIWARRWAKGDLCAHRIATFPPQLPGYTDRPHFATDFAVYLEPRCGECHSKQQ